MLPLRFSQRFHAFMCALSLSFFILMSGLNTLVWAADPPAQPDMGPGGRDYISGEIVQKALGDAKAPVLVYYAGTAPAQERSVIIFLHAWGAVNPAVYGGWIEHLVRKGHVVLWPRHQELWRSGGAQATDLAVEGLKSAFDALKNDPDVRPDIKKVAVVGHLAGAGVAVNIAARAPLEGLPIPKVVFAAIPGGLAAEAKLVNGKPVAGALRGIPLADLSQVPANTYIISAIGDREHQPSERTTRRLFRETTQVPAVNKVFMRVQSDDHGYPPHVINLTAPGSYKPDFDITKITLPVAPPLPKGQRAPRPVRALDANLSGEQHQLVQQMERSRTDVADYLGFWKILDLALIHAFQEGDATAFRNDQRLVDMGRWSNGWPVKRINVEAPREIPAPQAVNDNPSTPTTPVKTR